MVILDKPVVFFDLETTGVNLAADKIVQIGLIRCNADLTVVMEKSFLVNPGKPIPAEATKIHHITDSDVKDAPHFAAIAGVLLKHFEGADMGGYNIAAFDVPMLAQEFHGCGIEFPAIDTKFIDAYTIYQKFEPRDLTGAYRHYCGGELVNAHDAMQDTRASLDIFRAQAKKYKDLGPNASAIHATTGFGDSVDLAGKFRKTPEGVVVFTFGKHEGQPVLQHKDYLEWMLGAEFPPQTKVVIAGLLGKNHHTA